MAADLVVIGPGSIYSSVLPNLLVPGIREAIRSSRAVKIFVSNVASQIGETEGLDVSQHVQIVQTHVGQNLFDYVVANDNFQADIPSEWPAELVHSRPSKAQIGELRVVQMDVQMDVIDTNNPWRHDPAKLGEALLKVYYDQASRRAGQRVNVADDEAISA
jgi:uncharacterized cofD-like protein